MKKVVIFDSSYGGEFFADHLEEEIPILDVERVIDWRNLGQLMKGPKEARQVAETAIQPYIGHVDVIMFADYLSSVANLKYFQHKFKNQKFAGFSLTQPARSHAQNILVLTTHATRRTISFKMFVRKLAGRTRILEFDHWVPLIDDGELTEEIVRSDLEVLGDYKPELIILAHSDFVDAKAILEQIYGPLLVIEDGYHAAVRNLCSALNIRGLDGRKT